MADGRLLRSPSSNLGSLLRRTPFRAFLIIFRAMSSSPLRFRAPEKETHFDVMPVRKFIADLLVKPTNEVESEELEIKGWCRDERELAEKVSEACSCIANTTGGFVLVGPSEDKSQRKFSPCPHHSVTTAWLQTTVDNLTPSSRNTSLRCQ